MNACEDETEPLGELPEVPPRMGVTALLGAADEQSRIGARAARSGGITQLKRVVDMARNGGHSAEEIAEWAQRQIVRLEMGI